MNEKISVIIPAFNEGVSLPILLKRVMKVLKKFYPNSEIIVVDDCSVDRTFQVAQECGVKVLRNEVNLGKGGALLRGFSIATGDIILTMDADGSHCPEEIPSLVTPILENLAEMVVGARVYDDKDPPLALSHIFGNKILNFIIRFLTKSKLSDSLSGFRAIKRDVLKKLELYAREYDIEAEVTIKLLKKKLRVIEVPITCDKRMYGSSGIRCLRDGFSIFKRILFTYYFG